MPGRWSGRRVLVRNLCARVLHFQLFGILIGCASGRFPIRLQCARHDKKTFPTLVVAIWVCGERR